jgi:hypothetical protein
MNNTMWGIIFLGFGLYFAIFHRNIAHRTAEFNYKFWHIRYSEKVYRILFLLGGLCVITFGLLIVFQVIKMR